MQPESSGNPFEALLTPALILDRDVLKRNAARMRAIAECHGVRLRPHAKTSKCVEAVDLAIGYPERSGRESITVSTLSEAAWFVRSGYSDILYAVGVAPGKLPHVEALIRELNADVTLITDNARVAAEAARFAEARGLRLRFMVEVDSGEHRCGILPDSGELLDVARVLAGSAAIDFRGVMTHAGHSYRRHSHEAFRRIAAHEAAAAVQAAERVRQMGIPTPVVSVGSTPTALFAENLNGVTEIRPGVFMFFDLSMAARKVCAREEIALSVLASVIGHSPVGKALILDAGGLALSKDLGAKDFASEYGYGLVCDPATLEPLGGLAVMEVHQEHGTVPVKDESWFKRLPVGSLVRILPNHACMTAAAHSGYHVLDKGGLVGRWERDNGW